MDWLRRKQEGTTRQTRCGQTWLPKTSGGACKRVMKKKRAWTRMLAELSS